MEAIGLFFSRFSEELISAQIAMLSISLALGVYWMLVRKKKRETSEWVPAALVRAYLDRMRNDERETRIRLFGEDSVVANSMQEMPLNQMLSATSASSINNPVLQKEIDALRTQLSMADSRAMEFDRQVIGLRAEKSSLEQRLKDAQSAQNSNASAGPGGPDPKMVKELEELRAKLKEYEVIEDDLANLKKFQKENEELKARISQLESGGAALKVIPGGAPAPEATTTIPSATQKIETPVEKVSAAPAPVAAAPAPAQPETNTNVLAPVNPGDGDSSKKKEEELLSEFEKMLAS